MANKDAPFGLRPAALLGGGAYTGGQREYEISNADTTKIYQGDIVKGLATGYIKRMAAADGGLVVGVFNGCQFTDSSTGKPKWSNYWTGDSAVTSTVKAYVVDDPNIICEVQADAAFTLAGVFANYDIVDGAGTGSANSGISYAELDVGTGNTTASLPLKALAVSTDPDNDDTGSTNTNVVVLINNHFASAGTTGV
jgi:hypothetical protein|tara:strand:+ start:636 stop:1223 length:588 start_codon:yes stop_codon:yes gene_type:complete